MLSSQPTGSSVGCDKAACQQMHTRGILIRLNDICVFMPAFVSWLQSNSKAETKQLEENFLLSCCLTLTWADSLGVDVHFHGWVQPCVNKSAGNQ